MKARSLNFKNKNFYWIIAILFTLLTFFVFLTLNKSIKSEAFNGPLSFWTQFPGIFIFFGVASLLVFTLIPKICGNNSCFLLASYMAFAAFLVKILIPYYLFDGLIQSDIFAHHLNVEMLASKGLQPIQYLYWPSTFVSADAFEIITYTGFPVSISLIAILSKMLLACVLFLFIKRLFGPREAVLSVLLLTLIEPVSAQWSPFTITLTLILISLFYFIQGIIKNNTEFKILSAIIAFSTITYHPYLPLILIIMLICTTVFIRLIRFFKSDQTFEFKIGKGTVVASVLLVGTIAWWIFVAPFIFRSFIRTLVGEVGSLVYVPVGTTSEGLLGQYDVVSALGSFTLVVILLPIIPVVTLSLISLIKKRLNLTYLNILIISVNIAVMSLLWIFLTFIFPVGFGERFFFIAQLLLVPLSAVCMIQLKLKKKRKYLYLAIAVIFVFILIISPITSRSQYALVNIDPVSYADLSTGAFTLSLGVAGQSFTGDSRFNWIIENIQGPNQLHFLFFPDAFENKVAKNDFNYDSTIIIVNPGTLYYLTTHGIEDTQASAYINSLYNISNVVYNNGYNNVFFAK